MKEMIIGIELGTGQKAYPLKRIESAQTIQIQSETTDFPNKKKSAIIHVYLIDASGAHKELSFIKSYWFAWAAANPQTTVRINIMLGKFFITATPIGNLDDISIRMKETWVSVDVILCEDTRVTQTVLNHLKISKTVMSYHQHSDDLRIKEIAKLLQEGKSLALVTDAGTPGISDPGGRLIQELLKQFGDALNIIPIPGPSALTAALSICGFPADAFIFLWFPPLT